MCVCVRARARVCVRACVRVCVSRSLLLGLSLQNAQSDGGNASEVFVSIVGLAVILLFGTMMYLAHTLPF